MPKRINKVIELLEQGQNAHYGGTPGLAYEDGKSMAAASDDYIIVDMEHSAFDMDALGAFMRGLADGGPTASGHRTPAVVVVPPTDGSDEAVVRANAWMFKQALARGVHGILLCHAESSEAVKVFVEACRYPFSTLGVGHGLGDGRRGGGGQGTAAQVWGIPVPEYLERADIWPLNPDGEIILGLKIENKRALANAELITKVPGISFAQWGPGDMGMSLGFPDAHDPPYPEEMLNARTRVVAACKEAGVYLLEQGNTTLPA